MAFCTNCGAQTDAAFCTKCGKPMGAPAPSQGMPPAPTPIAQMPGAAKPKISPLVWILGAVVGVFVLVGILVVGAGLFVAHKAKNAGFDSALAEKNPALAAAKVMASLNPDVEIVNIDEDKGLLTIKDKKTGKVLTMNAEDVKNGKMTISDESTGEKVTFGANSAVQLPAWLPSYPGSKPEGTFSASGSGNEGGMAHFKTSDAGPKVLAFYQDALKSAGFKITSTFSGDSGDAKGGLVSAEDTANRRTVMVTVSSSGADGTDVSLTYGTKH
jgi:hypothetical protein